MTRLRSSMRRPSLCTVGMSMTTTWTPERWVKALDHLDTKVPVYLENTAGGENAIARHFDTVARLWDRIGDKGIGFCLDTRHAWAAGGELLDAVDRIRSITGRIDLVHCNDSRDAAGSGADRHAISVPGRLIRSY